MSTYLSALFSSLFYIAKDDDELKNNMKDIMERIKDAILSTKNAPQIEIRQHSHLDRKIIKQ